ncbi:ABC transporter ATP-binding protein [Protaetiibacter larvae]|uniref:ABC transporter ATP-binding protein n=1 Tax=Protaetiibacter larvae TaxID=2592654 RepID=A0A5C1Y6X6_9MICO|nr:ABC transporter ATP-binding protein [Protaetiibacter larvae]QEO08617.1 ABC transporter ATP-binding protein [Protaetiibacter larvae]
MSASTVISVDDVSKRFILHKEKSLKERLLNFRNRSLGREDFWALRDIDIDVASGETLGLIGANGSGKSTLLKVIGGIIQPTTGSVRSRGRLAALLELGAGFHPDLTGRENVYLNAAILGLTTKQTDLYFDDIVEFSGIEKFIDTQVKFYSSGMYVRLAFAVAVHVDPEILLIDEVLAVGDEPFQRKCLDKVRSFQEDGRTIVLVSHSAESIGSICTRGIVLQSGRMTFDGDTATALRVLRDGFEADRDKSEIEAARGMRVHSTRVLGVDGSDVDEIVPGDDVRVVMEVESDHPLEGWYAAAAFETPLGMRVYGTNTELLGVETGRIEGRRSVTFSFPGLRLGRGQYYVHVKLGTKSLGTVVDLPRAREIEVVDKSAYSGVLSVAASVSVAAS